MGPTLLVSSPAKAVPNAEALFSELRSAVIAEAAFLRERAQTYGDTTTRTGPAGARHEQRGGHETRNRERAPGRAWGMTTAAAIGGVAPAKAGYDEYLRFVSPLPAVLFALIRGFVALGVGCGREGPGRQVVSR